MINTLPRTITIVAVLTLALSACTRETRLPPPAADWDAHVAAVSERENWTLNGKIGVLSLIHI